MTSRSDEWLEADGLGGFASGTASLVRTRRYHALLLRATRPPQGRQVLVNGVDAFVQAGGQQHALTSQAYVPGVTSPDGERRIESFSIDPWPTWTFVLPNGLRIIHELFVPRGRPTVVLIWRATAPASGVRLQVRPLLSGRDYHALHRENAAFRFEPERRGSLFVWHPYPGVSHVAAGSSGQYRHEPAWYRQFEYAEERDRGLDFAEDLAAPGWFDFDLAREAVLVFDASDDGGDPVHPERVVAMREAERTRRASFGDRLARSADAYLVEGRAGPTIVAGYPWFTDWGRDTFISLRGLCLTNGRIDDARRILVRWSSLISDGMLPNRFPEGEAAPAFNSVDASLWFAVAVHDLFDATKARQARLPAAERSALAACVDSILEGYARGTRYGIRMNGDALLAAGRPGVQLTWMDAKIGDEVVTPRIGKAVEVQALWINALQIGARLSAAKTTLWSSVHARASAAFSARFWNGARQCLYDVIDVDHAPGAVDDSLRPNQVLAVGGLPFQAIAGSRAKSIVDVCEAHLVTPMGLRSLAPGERGYVGRYLGDLRSRDHAYHQGTVWPYLMGAFVEAWLRVRGNSDDAKQEARQRFVAPLLAGLDHSGLGHVSEIADGDPPHTPRGCPFQAWSLAELIRARAL